jgi:ribosome-associated protein
LLDCGRDGARDASKGPAGPHQRESGLDAKELALTIADAALDKQALSLEIIDVNGKVDYTRYIVICSGRSGPHVDAIADAIEAALKRHRVHALGVEGRESHHWVLMDFEDVIFHVFESDTRGYYDLEGLWIDAVRIPLRQAAGAG